MSQTPGKAPSRRNRIDLYLMAIIVVAVLFYISGGTREYHGTPDAQSEIAENRALLAAMEQGTPVDVNAELRRQYVDRLAARGGVMVDDLEAEQRKILSTTEWSKADIARWFQDTAIVGDSIILSTRSYGWLDAPVFAADGIHLSTELGLLQDVAAASPSVVFLCFGMNDVEVFQERVDRYTERYAACIRLLQEKIPGVIIYVQATLPVTEGALKKVKDYQYIDAYNEAMKERCPELGAYYVDPSFLLREMPELYFPDGVHPRREYYPMWLTYLADVAGLSDDE